jgi:hypothetical protein
MCVLIAECGEKVKEIGNKISKIAHDDSKGFSGTKIVVFFFPLFAGSFHGIKSI